MLRADRQATGSQQEHAAAPGPGTPATATSREGRRPLRAWLRALAALPTQCEVCHGWDRARVCGACVVRFSAPRPRCLRCALPMPACQPPAGATTECGECRVDPPPFAAAVCAVDYDFPWDQLIARLKFRGQPELAAALVARLAQALDATAWPAPDAVLPVPLAPQRLAQRGYNQAWELARRLARARGLAARADVLLRPLHTAQQAGLGRGDRQRNLRAAFFVPPEQRPWLAGRRLALVDDVMTTGATLREASAALLRAGAAEVQVWVVARTPAPGSGD